MATAQTSGEEAAPSRVHRAGAFDIRSVTGALIGLYGIVLLVAWLVVDPGVNPETGQPKDAANNLWAGIAMLAVAAAFFAWARLRPIVVDDD
ncbi:LPXTG cell wall anchor domain-containing protein [Corynebacterium otitidis]|uniref:LPXTG-domain-containing protein cell wall anchor domain n=1 Tax=Corynebacterium otitidis ATCC 51513 TaxID=883169 RepID=I7JW51_9CORY|nr:LPXTG cell wall anchor domain-containing protein [Corynebacterium otitidis]EJZ81964.1 LPXTG-domain-containing protein cell wall anchor domain [Corynebacterium otitidis ATCC 51513]KKO83465.1 cell wall anchor protein [Corynebacterium otitidis]CCI83641.1 putative membrane protein [Corynebacterium otitidis ATCC 51513]